MRMQFVMAAMSILLPTIAHAQSADGLVGTWQMTASVNTATDGKITHTYGSNGQGIIIFTKGGRFIIANMNPDVPKIKANNRAKGTAEENTAILSGELVLFGTYTVSDKDLTLKITASTFPNWNGTVQKRTIETLNDSELKYLVPNAAAGGRAEQTYKRVE
jgi:hypothetical protein